MLHDGFRAVASPGGAAPQNAPRPPPTERNRVGQSDFSEFETTNDGIWRISVAINYATKYRCVQLAIE